MRGPQFRAEVVVQPPSTVHHTPECQPPSSGSRRKAPRLGLRAGEGRRVDGLDELAHDCWRGLPAPARVSSGWSEERGEPGGLHQCVTHSADVAARPNGKARCAQLYGLELTVAQGGRALDESPSSEDAPGRPRGTQPAR
jgi:hypothetical protein